MAPASALPGGAALILIKFKDDFIGAPEARHFSSDMPSLTILCRSFVILVAVAILHAGCGRGGSPEPDPGGREFLIRGIVRGISPDRQTIDVHHETIPNYMPEMTMPFSVRDPKATNELRAGDAISFRMTVTEKEAWIDNIKKIGENEVKLETKPGRSGPAGPGAQSSRLRSGDQVPPFRLTNEQGETITADTFRGRPYIVTFIFSRCPIPNFCPLMNKNFAQLQEAIRSGSGPMAQARLLSISFDPEYDTPEVLRAYAKHEQADPALWSFATGEKEQIERLTKSFAVHVQPESGTVAHGLATALINSEGRVVEIWRGNAWKPEEVIARVQEENLQAAR
jgi:protein SCO1